MTDFAFVDVVTTADGEWIAPKPGRIMGKWEDVLAGVVMMRVESMMATRRSCDYWAKRR